MDALKRRIDPKTGLARPDWKGLARELHVSRSTISRRMPDLRDYGLVESVLIPVSPTPFPADDCPQQNPRHAKSPENRECVLGDFLGEFGFRFSPSFPFRPGQWRTKEKENPPIFRIWGFRDWSERRDLNPRPFAPEANALPGCATLRLG